MVTCVAVDETGAWVVTGSADTTCVLWKVCREGWLPQAGRGVRVLEPTPHKVLHGHDLQVTTVAIRSSIDMIVSGSGDGTAITRSLHSGAIIRVLTPGLVPARRGSLLPEVEWVCVSVTGAVCLYTAKPRALYVYCINGMLLGCCEVSCELSDGAFSSGGDYLFVGGENQKVGEKDKNPTFIAARNPLDKRLAVEKLLLPPRGESRDPRGAASQEKRVTSLSLSDDDRPFAAAMSSGKVVLYGDPNCMTNILRTVGAQAYLFGAD